MAAEVKETHVRVDGWQTEDGRKSLCDRGFDATFIRPRRCCGRARRPQLLGVDPVALALERIRRQRNAAAATIPPEAVPVDIGTEEPLFCNALGFAVRL